MRFILFQEYWVGHYYGKKFPCTIKKKTTVWEAILKYKET